MNPRIWLAMMAIYIVWGSTYLAIRFGVETIPPFLMAGTRFLIAGIILYVWRRVSGDARPKWGEWRGPAIVGLFLLVGGNGGVTWAEQRVPSGITALIIGATPLWIVLINAFRPGRPHLARMTFIGVMVGFAGIILLVGPGRFFGDVHALDMTGVIVLLLAALSWAAGSIYGQQAKLPSSPLLATGMEMLAGGISLLLLGTLAGEWSRLELSSISLKSVMGLLYLIIFGSLIGFAAYTWLLRVAPISLVSTYAYVNPLVAVILGSLLAQEPLTARILVSALIIVGAVFVINTSLHAPTKSEVETVLEQ